MIQDIFRNRDIVIATKHQKEDVIAPLLKKELALKPFVPKGFDTDSFGTFSGEIERKADALETARLKCLKAMELTGCDLGISNEGSFGVHPQIWFTQADYEIVVLIDKKNGFEFLIQEISTQTNFNGGEIKSYAQLKEFAKSVKFPSHGLILRKAKDTNEQVIKGIRTWKVLQETFNLFYEAYGEMYVETDMRAMHNPTRMKVIERAVTKLIKIIKTPCPKCSAPGFSIKRATPGLPCSQCGLPTRSTLKYVYECQSCQFSNEEMFPHKKEYEEPTFCDFCNP